jgi:hypothetical protein
VNERGANDGAARKLRESLPKSTTNGLEKVHVAGARDCTGFEPGDEVCSSTSRNLLDPKD